MNALSPEYVIDGLVRRGVPLHVAQGVTARLNGESGLNPGINEINPTVEGSRGGYGLAQWTGPRRVQYEAFAADRGADIADPETQLDFLMWENANTEKEAWAKVLQAPDAVTAAEMFTKHWERPGKPHLGATLDTARQYAGLQPDAAPQNPYERLAYAYANGKMTPEDAAIYERGMGEGVFPKAQQSQPRAMPNPLDAYAAQIEQRRSRQPLQLQPLQMAAIQNATPLQKFPGI